LHNFHFIVSFLSVHKKKVFNLFAFLLPFQPLGLVKIFFRKTTM
jgi:hypothetical protein